MGTSQQRSTSSAEIWERGKAFGIPGEAVDGMDVLAVKEAGQKAVEHARKDGPYILEIKTYRYRGHSMSDPAKYRTREEVQKMRDERDPIEAVRNLLLTGNHAIHRHMPNNGLGTPGMVIVGMTQQQHIQPRHAEGDQSRVHHSLAKVKATGKTRARVV
jgi:hypothetical protein